MKRILLLTVGALVACFFGGVDALDLDGRILPWMIGSIISSVAGVFAVSWQCLRLENIWSMLQTMR